MSDATSNATQRLDGWKAMTENAMAETWTIQRILSWIEDYLGQHGDENPRISAQWLVSEALGLSRMQLFLDLERPLTEDERAVLRDYTKRRAAGEPLQYITGESPFRYITVKVAPGVLIPRPETEVLVSEALSLLPKAAKPQDAFDQEVLRHYAELAEDERFQELGDPLEEPTRNYLVADICTGTGCIACALASERADVRVIATDIDITAVRLAQENAERLDLLERVTTFCCDLGNGIDAELLGNFDLIVSNPPYVPTSVLADIPNEVAAYEPRLALDGGEDGLDIFRALLDLCAQALRPGGAFAFELHETTLDVAADLAKEAGFENVRIAYDLAGKPRILTGTKQG